MAIIQCHECKKDISDAAEVCPGCGSKTLFKIQKEQAQISKKGLILIVIALAFVGLIGRAIYVENENQKFIRSGGAAAAQDALESIQDSVRQMERARKAECESRGGRWSHSELECKR